MSDLQLTTLYVRFFRSFNFDYERKANSTAEPKDWELIDGSWFPFIRVDLDAQVTAVVGANESGKSHLISAVRVALGERSSDRRDFCRYSTLYSVETGAIRSPDFGLEVELAGEADADIVAALSLEGSGPHRVTLLRLNGGPLQVVASGDAMLKYPMKRAI